LEDSKIKEGKEVFELKKMFLVVLFALIMVSSALAMTDSEFALLKTGDIVHAKIEWNGKVYLEGDAVVAYKISDSALVAGTNPQNGFVSTFNHEYLTLVKSKGNEDTAKLRQELEALKAQIRGLVLQIVELLK
jgi:hypothetical protein